MIRNLVFRLFLITLMMSKVFQGYAQYDFFTPEGSFAIEISLANTDLKRLPMYRNAITSLSVIGENVIGGTTADEGLAPFIFVASLEKRELINFLDLNEIIEGQQAIRTGFSKNQDGALFAGTMAQNSEKNGGHLIKIEVTSTGDINIEDLGIPVPGESVFALTNDEACTTLYGISYPSGHFFSFDIQSGKTKVFDDVAISDQQAHSLDEEYSLKPEDFLSRDLTTDNNGLVYGSLPYGKLFYFDPKKEQFQTLSITLPEVWGRRSLGQIDGWLKAGDGKLYGGNRADGQLFELDPSTQTIKNLGKPIMMNGLAGLTFGRDGKIYGIAGGSPGYAHLFSYDKDTGFEDYGNPQFTMVAPGIEQGIAWRGFQLATIASSEDGKYIVLGENEALSHILVFPVDDY
jgi:hypothetical protein